MPTIILASTSPRRKEILAKLGVDFVVEASPFIEDMSLDLSPGALAKYLAEGKAKAVAHKHNDAIVIGADTLIAFEGEVLGKPRSAEEAKTMLKKLSGKPNSVLTGFAIIDSDTGKITSDVLEAKVYFRKLSDEDINGYVASGEPLDKAGAYAIQGLGAVLIDKIEGDYLGIVGLPLSVVAETLRKEFAINYWQGWV